ncbi:hypothetical protein N9Z47_03665, partial [bacterium]|nr:hypothetical protein [bacterium]
MSKTKKSLDNVVASVVQVVILQLITLIVSRKVLSVYGSDINGVNAVFTNTLVWMMLIEGGFTFASSVALFKAFASKDTHQVNRILSATKKVLNKIGLLVGLGGIALAFTAPFFIKTTLSYELLSCMFLLMAFGTYFGLSFTRKYALMFSVKQELYFKTYIAVFVSIVVNAVVYLIASQNTSYLWIRGVFALGVVLTGVITAVLVRKRYPFISFGEEPDMEAIKGTKDMVFGKFTSLVRSSVPIIYIASVAGAAYASVYAVYMIIFGFITKLCMMVTNAVQNSFGQLVAEKDSDEVYKKFRVFEYAVIFMSLSLISVSTPMTLPFIRFYTRNVHDVDYISWNYVVLFTLITFVQMVHIPSGIIMLMAGEFKQAKKIQLNTLALLILGIVIGGFFGKITGILSGVLIAGMFLAGQEIVFTREKYFGEGFHDLIKALAIIGATTIGLIALGLSIVPEDLSFLQ